MDGQSLTYFPLLLSIDIELAMADDVLSLLF